MNVLFRPVSVLLIAFMFTGCSSTKQVPREEFEAASQLPTRIYDVRTKDNSLYVVRHYSVTDSTLAITELHKKDERYGRAVLPIVLQLDEVTSMKMKDQREGGQVAVLALFTVVGVMIVAIIIQAATDEDEIVD